MMMDESYRMDTPPNMYSVDLDSTWSGGESGQNSKVKPPALSTARLKVFRQVTRGAILSILETGHVSIEFLKKKGDQDRLVELFIISGDGQEICVEQWKTDCSSSIGSELSVLSGDIERMWKTFSYNALPEKYWKKYAYACRFVDLVKSKTAKVTMYSDRAKGVLMENSPSNFETTFFNGPKLIMCGNEVHIKDDSGVSFLCHRDSHNNYTMSLLQHATQMREQCIRLEASVMTVQAMSQNSEALFPVTVGMRPSTSFCSSTSSNSGSIDFLSSPRFSHLHSSPSSGSQGHSASPPSSPGPQVDLRCMDSSKRHTPTSHPSSTDGKSSQSPFRHISTLEGRKFRRRLSDSADSSYIHYSNGVSKANKEIPCPETLRRSPEEFAHVQQQLFILPPVTSASPQRNPTACDTKAQTPCFPGEEQGRQLTEASATGGYGRQTTPNGTVAASCFTTSDSQTMLASPTRADNKDLAKEEISTLVRQTFVAYTGWASEYANGTIWIRYNEGTQLGVYRDQLEPVEVVYVDQQGNSHRYLKPDVRHIPEVVKQKLEKLPMVFECLQRCPSASPCTLAST